MEFQTPPFLHTLKRLLDSVRFRLRDIGHRINATLMGRAHDAGVAANRISSRAESARGRAQDAAADAIVDGATWVSEKTGWAEIRARMAARAEEAAIRRRLWWARVHAAWTDRASAAAWWVSTRLENARWWLLDRLGPPARRVADRLEAASERAAARREDLARRLADFRDRHAARLPRAVRDMGLPQAERAILSIRFNWKVAVVAVLAIGAAAVLREMTRPTPPAPPTKDEIALVRSFVNPVHRAAKPVASPAGAATNLGKKTPPAQAPSPPRR